MAASKPPTPMPPQLRPSTSPRSFIDGPTKSFLASWLALKARQKTFIVIWCAVLLIPATMAYRFLTEQQHHNVQLANEQNTARMGTAAAMQGHTQPEKTPPPGHESDVPRVVKIGMYINRVTQFSIVDSSWNVDFYIWFNWEGEDLDPGETFKMATGEVLTRELLKKSDTGNDHYELYRATAQISKKFDVSRFPRDEHQLTISVEDKKLQSYQLKYATDPTDTDVSSRADVQGYAVTSVQVAVKPHSYKSAMGDPALPHSYKATYSQFIVGIMVSRPTWGLYMKMFLALYIAMFLALGGLFLVTPSERLALGGTAIFVAIMNAESNASLIPSTGTATLGDVIDALGYCAMGVIITQAIIYHRFLYRDGQRTDVARLFDAVSIVLIFGLWATLNVGVLVAAAG